MESKRDLTPDVTDSIGDFALTGITEEHQWHVHKLLAELWQGPTDTTPESATDSALNSLIFKDFPALQRARAQLAVKDHDLKLDVIFWSQITAMAGMLNLYLDSQLLYTYILLSCQLVTISSCFIFCFIIYTYSLLYFFLWSFFQPNKSDFLTVLFAIRKAQFLFGYIRWLHILEHFLASLYNSLYPLSPWLDS